MSQPTEKAIHPAWELVYTMTRNHSALGANITALRTWLASQDLPDPATRSCPKCGIQRGGPRSLAEHLYIAHDGELPGHWNEDA